jgi:GMP synthase (glutamine-hydrolysing)
VRIYDGPVKALVLQHIACEPPGVFEDVLRDRGAEIHRVELDEGERPPDWREFDLIVAMGGPMSVNDEDEHPWLVAEKRLIREAVDAGVGYWGACLGVQLLASALGARVYAGAEPEVGVLPVTLTDAGAADPVLGALPREVPSLQWHGDTFDLPDGAVLLASSPAYPNQAFRYGRAAYGVQFHVEVTGDMAREWAQVPAYVDALDRTLGPGAAPELFAAFDRSAAEMQAHGRTMFERWVDVAVPAPR